MVDYSLSGTHALNAWVWSRLLSSGLITPLDTGISSIIPGEQESHFENEDNPYIVYNYTSSRPDDMFYVLAETVAYRVYGKKESDVRSISNYIGDLCGRMDIAGQECTDYLYTVNRYAGIEIKYLQTMTVTTPHNYIEDDPDRFVSNVVIRFDYTIPALPSGMRL